MAEVTNFMTGARARFSLDGVDIGYARNVAITEEIQYDPVEVLNNIEVDEFVPVAYRVTFTASLFRVVGNTLKSNGFFPNTSTQPADHLAKILDSAAMKAVIEDTRTSRNIATLTGVKIASHNWTIDARGIVGQDVTFVAIRVRDESEGA